MKFKKLAALMAVMTMVASFSVVNVSAETESAENETAAEETTNGAVQKIVANCESDSYGKAIHSFTFYVDSVENILGLTADDFETSGMVYDGNETHTYKSGKALDVTFTANTMTVEIDPFYPSSSFSSEGFWAMTCTNPDFSVDAESTIEFSDPVVESFEQLTLTSGISTMESYLYSPEDAEGPLPIVIFNSGGTGISISGDLYGANYAVSYAKEDAQKVMPCYVLYPQRTEGSVEEFCDAIKAEVDELVAAGKVDENKIYMCGESAGSLFTMNFCARYPGYNSAIVIFDGGGSYEGTTLEETMKEDADSPFSDADTKTLAESGTKVMLVQSIGDTTSQPIKYATTYEKLVADGMKPGVDVLYHTYTAEQFNALLEDDTKWLPMADSEYVTDPETGIVTYNYQEGKLHNSSYPAAQDEYIKLWLLMQSKGEYEVEFQEAYSAAHGSDIDYSVIPDRYTKVAVLEDAPGVPAGSKTTLTVYTDDEGRFYYIEFKVPFKDEMQYVEAIVVAGEGHTVADCSGGWWTGDINGSVMPYILSLDNIDWQPYER